MGCGSVAAAQPEGRPLCGSRCRLGLFLELPMKILLPVLMAVAVLFAAGSRVSTQSRSTQASRPPAAPSADWTMFGGDVAKTNASTAPTPINVATVATLVRHQATVDGIIDASVIYLKGAQVNGAAHDTLFATTRFGETV